ncbi:hypothetical protein CYMTET_53197, partial [Cymbomonas tetramitiformis]
LQAINVTTPDDGKDLSDSEGPEKEMDYQLLCELFESTDSARVELPDVLWILNVFFRAMGYENGLTGKPTWRLIKALGKLDKLDTAKTVFEALPVRSSEEYEEMVCAYARNGEAHLEPALELIRGMPAAGVEITPLIYVRFIHHLSASEQSSAAEDVLRMMQQDSSMPEEAVHDAFNK